MKRILILILSLTFISAEVDLESLIFTQFQRFIKKYQKNYSSMKEYLARFQVFRLNFKETLNLGSQNYLNGITKFSDLTRQEFAKKYLNSDFPAIVYLNQDKSPISLPKAAPAAWDWREQGVIGPAKNQGSCGAAYAFSTISNLESIYAINKGTLK